MNDEEIKKFWNKDVSRMVKNGWDPPLAYIHLILKRLQNEKLKITNQDLRDFGKKVQLFPGVRDLFERLKSFVGTRNELREAHVQIEFYVISGGFEEIIRGTPLCEEMKDIFGSILIQMTLWIALAVAAITIGFAITKRKLFLH